MAVRGIVRRSDRQYPPVLKRLPRVQSQEKRRHPLGVTRSRVTPGRSPRWSVGIGKMDRTSQRRRSPTVDRTIRPRAARRTSPHEQEQGTRRRDDDHQARQRQPTQEGAHDCRRARTIADGSITIRPYATPRG